MADSNSSSDSSSDSSDFEVFLEVETSENELEPFSGIHPWRFEPQGRNREANEREERAETPRRRCNLATEDW